jgi:hypothetical protein
VPALRRSRGLRPGIGVKTDGVRTLARYLEIIVDPTFDDFHANRGSARHAYLTCVSICHAADRVAEENGETPTMPLDQIS